MRPTTEKEAPGERLITPITPQVMLETERDEDYLKSWLFSHVLRDELTFMQSDKWPTFGGVRDLPEEILGAAAINRQYQAAIIRIRGLTGYVWISPDSECTVWLYGERFVEGEFAAAFDQIRLWLKPREETDEAFVTVGFRYRSERGGPGCRTRRIEAPEWADIQENYAEATRSALGQLFDGFQPGAGGRLILLHGVPGSGKTYVIRALARAWRDWCRVEYVADPESFFGNTDYMMQALADGEHTDDTTVWRMLVIEDAGELLAQDAKLRQGQGLSRLLNLSEGLIGQGMRVLMLITTNERLQSLHDAVSRPGRTAAEIEFTALSTVEAAAWLADHGRPDIPAGREMTLAELYAALTGATHTTQKERERIGFLRG